MSTQDLKRANRPVSLLILEGDTESVFYPLIRDNFLGGIRVELRQVQSGGNINKHVLSKILSYTYNNPGHFVRVYCCSDTDCNNNNPTPLDIGIIRKNVKDQKDMRYVLSVDKILADPEIESWFFYDIEGIYVFLSAEKSRRNPQKYKNIKNLCKKDLRDLFEQFGRVYAPGKKGENFINHLDLNKIVTCCGELRTGIERIKAQATNLRNHILRGGRQVQE